ncbi:MAG: phosphopantetheine-binding protein, partial [Myxococcota bacterium]
RAAVRVAPAGVEARLEALWRELLGVDSVGPHDNFFDLGGSSLIGIRLVGRIRSELGVELSEVDLFEAPTLASLTSRVRGTAEVEVPVEVVDRARRRRERRITERGES